MISDASVPNAVPAAVPPPATGTIMRDPVRQHKKRRLMPEAQEEQPDVKLGRSKFTTLKPGNVKPQTKHAMNQCNCEYCANTEPKLQAIHRGNVATVGRRC